MSTLISGIESLDNAAIVGTEEDDLLFGTPEAESIDGLGGNDIIIAGDGDDTLEGGAGDDFIDAEAGDDLASGGVGNDIIVAGAGDDTIVASAGFDIIIGDDGTSDLDDIDTVDFSSFGAGASSGVIADLSLGTAIAGIDFIGEVLVPTGTIFTDDTLGDTEIGGLSGLEFDPATGSYFALSDSQEVPQLFYTLDLVIEGDALTDVAFLDAVQILDSDGEPFADAAVDPESIRIAPDGASLFFTGETGGGPEDIDDDIPFVAEIDFDGTPIAGPFTFEGFGFDDGGTPDDDSDDTGIRNNLGFESLTFAPDGTAFTATENALFQDGPVASLTESSPSRVIQFDPETGESLAQFIYEVEPIPVAPDPIDAFADNGLVEILAISETEFLFVERSFAVGIGNTIRVFLGDTSAATDVSDLASIEGADVTAIDKTLLFDTASFGIDPDNIEGITFGPTLEDGRQTFFLVSDNNFNDVQVTQFLGFALDGEVLDVEIDTLTDIENLTGSELDDFLTGDDGDNVLIGNGGDDFLNGSGGADSLEGGAGDDTIVSDALDTIDGGIEGSDTVDFSGLTEGIIIDLDVESAGALGTPGQNGGILAGPPAIDADGVESADNILLEVDDIENIIGTDFNDLLIGNNESNEILAGAGDDTLAGVAADDILDGGDGIDTALFTFAPAPIIVDLAIAGPQLIGPPGTDTLISIENVSGSDFASDTLLGNDEGNVLSSLAFDDVLDGRAGDDTLNGGSGDDTLTGGTGSNILDGGDGTDTAVFAGLEADFAIEAAEDGTVSVSSAAAGIDDVLTGIEVLSFDDVDIAVADLIEDGPFIGTPGDDLILGGIDIDAIGDTILAGAGDDEILLPLAGVGAGDNTVLAGSGDDTIFASSDDTILGGEGDDTFIVEETGNSLLGAEGDDTFILTGGDNVAAGGAGADVFIIAAPGDFPEVANVIADFDVAADLLGGVSFEEVTFAGSDILVDGAAIATLIGVDTASLTAESFV